MSVHTLACLIVMGFTLHGAHKGAPVLVCLETNSDAVLAQLSLALDDFDPEVRLEAVAEMAGLGGPQVAVKLADVALFDEDALVREEAIYGLADIDMGDEETILPTLERALFDPVPLVREAAVEAVIEIGGDDSARVLAFTLHDDDAELREEAVYALGEIGGQLALGYVLQAMADEDDAVRDAAAQVLEQRSRSDP